jgi:dTDP-4-dehydrorhamnose reductase
VIHCAAWTAVDACESDPDRAFAVNGLAVRWVAEACRGTGAHLIHLSTDYVFSGAKSSPYVEWDVPAPLNVYGASKLAGEKEAIWAGIGATIVRTSWVVGQHGHNIVKTILSRLSKGQPLAFVEDQRGQPTFTRDLARMLRMLAVERRGGVHHVTNQGAVTWLEFAREVVQAAGVNPDEVRAITTSEMKPPRPAARPANSVLDNAVLRLAGLTLLPDFRETLADVVTTLRSTT